MGQKDNTLTKDCEIVTFYTTRLDLGNNVKLISTGIKKNNILEPQTEKSAYEQTKLLDCNRRNRYQSSVYVGYRCYTPCIEYILSKIKIDINTDLCVMLSIFFLAFIISEKRKSTWRRPRPKSTNMYSQ